MRLSQSWVAHQDEIFSTIHVAALSQFKKERFGNILHRLKVVLSDLSLEGEPCPPDRGLDAFGLTIRDLGCAQPQQKTLKRKTITCGISRVGGIRLEKGLQAQLSKIGFEQGVIVLSRSDG